MTDNTIRFLLNDELIMLENIDPNLTVLQYLRDIRFQSGTKEGCASGDCGACTVVLAELAGEEFNELNYKSANACILFVGSLHGKQLITVEHLKEGQELHPVQQAIVDFHGSQCGFCTPGFVMSSFALHKAVSSPDRAQVVEALAGNLCRCTGYRSIIEAAMASSADSPPDSFARHYHQTVAELKKIHLQAEARLSASGHHFYSPTNIDQLADYLLAHPKATLLGGGTDLALSVTQQLNTIDKLVFLGNVKELNGLRETQDSIIVGSAVPYSLFTPLLHQQYPELGEMIERIGSTQIRNNGTLGGNIGNASPIGDMPPALIALGATMTLRRGDSTREMPVEDYFKGYKVTDLAESEFIQDITIPKAKTGQECKVYKISKRIDDDISAVLAAISIEIEQDSVKSVSIAYGGMAAIPQRAVACEAALKGQPWTQGSIDAAKQALTQDFQPMSDVRASDKYRMTVAQNLLQKCFLELQNRHVETRVVNYA
ncbi:xanthine dehydrogenase small subunit [Thalassomonas haliotis]|uniref:Xanthine dehydrogenase small subunit n=1 Tax=Thalassomonas haliotis TaxID=485448 RepID=A0ABY7VJX1_9GAMM|nr:xanthine dehydrogenase small subunit [Thalassomonas haliotis]WDE14045.1 xanthine dehydrogenase small subunit [Thalassomonas haliotis]